MKKQVIKYIVDVGLLISFLAVALTGIFKFPGMREHLAGLYEIIPRAPMGAIHDWSGIALAVLVLIHLILNWGWIKAMTRIIIFKEIK